MGGGPDFHLANRGSYCAWRPDLSADLPGHLTGPVATPHVLYPILPLKHFLQPMMLKNA